MNRPISFCRTRSAARALAVAAALVLASLPAVADEYAEVQRLHGAGQTSAALQRADRYIAGNPRDPQMRFIRANLLGALGRGSDAEEALTQLTRDYPELAEPWNNLAVLHARSGRIDQAREALEAALRINPNDATALENLGDVLARQASAAYQRASRLDTHNPRLAPKIEALRAMLAPAPAGAANAPAAAR